MGIGGGSIFAETSVEKSKEIIIFAVYLVFCHELTLKSSLRWLL